MKKLSLIVCFILMVIPVFSQEKTWKIDSIQIQKNWRTRDKIILRELQFKVGDKVDEKCLENSMSQLWNIGNFAKVDFQLDTISPGSYLLDLTAKDAFTLVPYVTFSGNKDDSNLSMGFNDNNFLGRNIKLELQGNIGTYRTSYNAEITIPRQLLYKNMTLNFRVLNGSANNYRYQNNQRISAIAYRKLEFTGGIGNPWHDDYKYTFSPNLSWNLFQHKTDSSLINTELPFAGNYEINYLALSVGESIGLINRKKHQKDGYVVSLGYGIGIGLDKNSPVYHSLGFGASFYKLINPLVEFSSSFSSGYTTSTLPSLIHYMSSGNIKGLNSGQESGQGYYNAKIGVGLTYINTDWFALEHSLYTNFGKAGDHYFELYKFEPRISFGSGFRFWIPMIPWLSAAVHVSFMKGSSNWLHLDI